MEAMKSVLKRNEQASFTLRGLYRSFGYLPFKMSRFEEYELYVRNKDFLSSQQFITFAGPSGKLLALKPDITLSIIKSVQDRPGLVQKFYYNENVYRADAPGGDIREIMQTGLECVGDLGGYEIAEVTLLAAKSLSLLGEDYVLNISHTGLIAAVLESCGVTSRRDALECLRQKNAHDLCAMTKNPRKLAMLAQLSGSPEVVLPQFAAAAQTQAEHDALRELEDLWQILKSSGCASHVKLDFSVGNDMKYYSGVVFKGYLAGIPTGILSGGQYDRLLQSMGRRSRAIGFALYLNLLERQGDLAPYYDVDTLILHDGTEDTGMLMNLAREAAETGSVLVATEPPAGRSCRKCIDLRKGEKGE